MSAIVKLMPYKEDSDKNYAQSKASRVRLFRQSATSKDSITLTTEDVKNMTKEVSRMENSPDLNIFKKLCTFKCFCKKSKILKMQERFFDEFENKLDIRKIGANHLNLKRFINVFLTKEQRLLLRL